MATTKYRSPPFRALHEWQALNPTRNDKTPGSFPSTPEPATGRTSAPATVAAIVFH